MICISLHLVLFATIIATLTDSDFNERLIRKNHEQTVFLVVFESKDFYAIE